MNPPHAIQLRFPWQQLPLADGRIRYRRHFHRPTGLAAADRVLLVLRGASSDTTVQVNGRRVSRPDAGPGMLRVDVTDLLEPRNLLELVSASAGGMSLPRTPRPAVARGGPPCEVCLEIWPGGCERPSPMA